MKEEQFQFQAEVTKLLNIVTHALYSDRDVFLRELISNAADACDKRRYLTLTNPEIQGSSDTYKITLRPDPALTTLTLIDNGIGMNRDELITNLGTIAHSGTSSFIDKLKDKSDINLIGQFGVGFYSAFMVASKVVLITRKAGEEQAWRWSSEGLGSYEISETTKETCGTEIILYLKEDAKDYLEESRLSHIVKTYSDHISIPIVLQKGQDEVSLNTASALWTRPKSEISAETYRDFYRQVAYAFDDPALTIHFKAEGMIEYAALLFVPSARPLDLFNPERANKLKLHVKKVFITDNCQDLLPSYLRFLRGVVDSEDLPLNISREMLQKNPVLTKIRAGLVKKILEELVDLASTKPEAYASLWSNFGLVLKEGLYEDDQYRPQLLELCRFTTSTHSLVSLKDYIGRMKEGQEAIYYISGESEESLRQSPQLEGFENRGIEVLLLTDPVDDFWLSSLNEFQGKSFKSVTQGTADLPQATDDKNTKSPEDSAQEETLLAFMKKTLEGKVKDVRMTNRLSKSPVCLVADDGDIDLRLEKLLKQHGRLTTQSLRVLELNPHHPLINGMGKDFQANQQDPKLVTMASLLFDLAKISQGEHVDDTQDFTEKFSSILMGGTLAA